MTGLLRVAISGLHLGENSQPGPGVIASLREAFGGGLRVVGLVYDAFDSGAHAPELADEVFLMPYPGASVDAYGARLAEVHARAPFDLLVPCLDVELPVLHHLRPLLRERGIATVLPEPEALAARAKDRLPALAARCGLDAPATTVVRDVAELQAAARELGFPCVVKGPFYEAEVVHDPVAAEVAFARLAARWGLPLLAQRFVDGDEYDVVALGDGAGGTLGAVPMRKTVLTKLGKAWGGITVDDDELLAAATAVVRELRWRGGCEVELLRARGSGALHLIEVNPRFPAWVHLATRAGVNLPHGLAALAHGTPLPRFPAPRAGVFYVRHAVQVFGGPADLQELLATGHHTPPNPPPNPRPR